MRGGGCTVPAACLLFNAGTLKHPTMKAKFFGHLRITVYAAVRALNA